MRTYTADIEDKNPEFIKLLIRKYKTLRNQNWCSGKQNNKQKVFIVYVLLKSIISIILMINV